MKVNVNPDSLPSSAKQKAWLPWLDNLNQGPLWPIRRITFRQPSLSTIYQPWDVTLADRMFSAQDDLALDLPSQQDRPATQRWELAATDLNGDGDTTNDPLTRQSRGNYSWIVTVAPTTADARDALATDPSAHLYEVSVVVFHKRPLPLTSPTDADELATNMDMLRENERAVRASIVSTGLNGGEVLLERYPAPASPGTLEPKSSPFDILKTGHWILLCGPHPNSTIERPNMVARWYRVLSISDESSNVVTNPANQRLVALRGPVWPWRPEPGGYLTSDHLSNSLYACISTGAVAVHARTISLEGKSVWSGGAASVNGAVPPGSPNSF
jgi:hypothetical protein